MKLASIFSDHMILQRDMPIRVFGRGRGEGQITFLGQTVQTQGSWMSWEAELDPHPAGGPYEMEVVLNGEKTVIRDIYIGEVFLAGGQSNMEFRLFEAEGGPEDVCDNSMLRHFTVPLTVDPEGEFETPTWQICTAESCLQFSAIGYYFQKELQGEINVPVGVISCNQSASRVEAWMDRMVFRGTPMDTAADLVWIDEQRPFGPMGMLYQNKLSRVIPYGMRGVLWYQGESNRGRREAGRYGMLFAAMVENWREAFRNPEMPFFQVQLSPKRENYDDSDWGTIRDEQLAVTKRVKGVELINIDDVGDTENLHPPKKREVGKRLAWAAQNYITGSHREFTGPQYSTMDVEEGVAYISFTHGKGLHVRGEMQNLFICGENEQYHPAQYRIEGDRLAVFSPKVPNPVGVRMGWCAVPNIALFNDSGIPAAGFSAGIHERFATLEQALTKTAYEIATSRSDDLNATGELY